MRVLVLVVLLTSVGCPSTKPQPIGVPPESFCPGAQGCENGADGVFEAGMAVVDISPRSFERPNPDYLDASGDSCPEQTARGRDERPRCGSFVKNAFRD